MEQENEMDQGGDMDADDTSDDKVVQVVKEAPRMSAPAGFPPLESSEEEEEVEEAPPLGQREIEMDSDAEDPAATSTQFCLREFGLQLMELLPRVFLEPRRANFWCPHLFGNAPDYSYHRDIVEKYSTGTPCRVTENDPLHNRFGRSQCAFYYIDSAMLPTLRHHASNMTAVDLINPAAFAIFPCVNVYRNMKKEKERAYSNRRGNPNLIDFLVTKRQWLRQNQYGARPPTYAGLGESLLIPFLCPLHTLPDVPLLTQARACKYWKDEYAWPPQQRDGWN
ncbi:unnamed protein product [Cylindrotheca closterium]|uniref:Uncharacterized protein n=1 Tax=Cylindrotheca closterium TaxID=2856 RepID=A0AAD2CQQ4_9STRA|nr:unnamed protein product [Cylindrotheca closterium]